MTEETDPIAIIIQQHESIAQALQRNIQQVVTANFRKEERIRDLEALVRLYANPLALSDDITVLRRKLGV